MNAPRLAALAALVLMGLAVAYVVLFIQPEVTRLGEPGYQGAAVGFLIASAPAIGDFAREFHVNDENPFVPYHDRVAETRRIRLPPQPVVAVKPPVRPVLPPPVQPVVVVQPEKPKPLVLPRAQPIAAKPVPQCIGLIAHAESGNRMLLVRDAAGVEVPLAVGAQIDGWELLEVLEGGAARFRDPDGAQQLLLIAGDAPDAAVKPDPAPGDPPPSTAKPVAKPPPKAGPAAPPKAGPAAPPPKAGPAAPPQLPPGFKLPPGVKLPPGFTLPPGLVPPTDNRRGR